MMSVTDPGLCKRVALRYSVACIGICSLAAPLLEVTTWAFALDTLPLNGYLTYLAWKFYKKADSNSSRKLFRFTLIHLPLLMTLMFINRKKKIPSDSSDQVLNQTEGLKLK
jgi:protoheme IX farnesyltransferase